MKGRIQKLGKSFVFRIPQSVADELQWKDGTLVQANIQDRKLIIEAIAVPDYDLEYLLKNMTPEHFQVDIDTGLPVGNEVWKELYRSSLNLVGYTHKGFSLFLFYKT